jgi:GABA(A) receptor-associated protein
MAQSRYKKEKTFQDRREESSDHLKKYPGHVPVVVDRDPRSHLPDIERQKFLVPSDLTVGNFVYVIWKRINLQPTDAIFLFVNRKLPPRNDTMGKLYQENHDEDGFMYCTYSSDSAYGH